MRFPGSVILIAFILSILVDKSLGGWKSKALCIACKSVGGVTYNLLRWTNYEVSRGKVGFFCKFFSFSTSVCYDYIDSWIKPINYIIQHSELSIGEICDIYLDSCGSNTITINQKRYSLGPPSSAAVLAARERNFPNYTSAGLLKVAHIADIHMDLSYMVSSSNSCSDPICCRSQYGFPPDRQHQAGYWGDYKCDAPERLVDSLLQQLQQHQPLDYVIWTGDNFPHGVEHTNSSYVEHVQGLVTSKIQNSLPHTQVLPVVGNHDTAPVNAFLPFEVERFVINSDKDYNWNYKMFAQLWSPWLPSHALQTLRYGGYYSVTLDSGVRIIVINTNVAYKFNFWVLMTAKKDPFDQLAWLDSELSTARTQGQKCHIVGHVSPSHADIIDSWSRDYMRIVSSYADVVRGHFFSHTHLDEVQVHTNDHDQAFLLSYVAPSLTPWFNVNPGYKIYEIDGLGDSPTWEVVDSQRWYLDLEKANESPNVTANWQLSYTTREQYQLSKLSLRHWKNLFDRMKVDDSTFLKYYRNLVGQREQGNKCGRECRQALLDNLVTKGGTRGRTNPFDKFSPTS